VPEGTTVFETAPIDHSGIFPNVKTVSDCTIWPTLTECKGTKKKEKAKWPLSHGNVFATSLAFRYLDADA
ncbi:MAG: hypothetical protein K2O01_02830, partial [Bacteroidales bacterium]|nr:hypothetical protein [Bacteroidales bacterium]